MPVPTFQYDMDGVPTKEDIMEKIREWIITSRIAPGEKIADIDIAAYFNFSRTPVREVLKILEQQKLICTYPGRATVVAPLETDNIEDLYVPMRMLQCLAAKLAVDNATAENITELIDLNEEFYVKLMDKSENPYNLLMADKRFHDKIVEMSGNEYIKDFCETLWTHISRLDYIFFKDTALIKTSYNDHLQLIEAMRMKDPFGAELAMQTNWTNSMLAILSILDKQQ